MTTLKLEGPSPLEEASPDSLQELFSRDPLQLTDPDVEKIVQILRDRRALWNVEETRTQSGKKKVEAQPGLSLEDLGL